MAANQKEMQIHSRKEIIESKVNSKSKYDYTVVSHNGKGEQPKVSKAAPTTSASVAAVLQPQKCTPVRHSVTHQESNKNYIIRINKVGDIRSNTTPTIFDACKEQKTSEKEKIPLLKNMNPVQLSRAQIELLVDKLLKDYPHELHKYRSLAKREFVLLFLEGVATGLCKNRAEPNLLNTVLREKLKKSIFMSNKDNSTRKDGKSFL
ncbi:hypothetical protein DM860_010556 [Cuscuta australis]|uniref:Asn/Gln amidotransferase domain-containing protein n=1 Tax=Cuscuta australis TaxID=267555 RepID=A0A328E5D8_9ASTE|nr:hypothetical protein DM860_010556 [Cuscuta australis]